MQKKWPNELNIRSGQNANMPRVIYLYKYYLLKYMESEPHMKFIVPK